MIARFIQRLTLFAFTAHAVLGCCWHHSHAIANDGCVDRVEHARESGEHTHVHSIHECHTHGDESETPAACETAATASELVSCDSHDSHSHDCNEAQCSFLVAKFQTLALEHQASFSDLVFLEAKLFAVSGGNLIDRVSECFQFAGVMTSGQRCADLQSWQI